MTVREPQAWRVIARSVMLDVVDPDAARMTPGVTGDTVARIFGHGDVIRQPLAPELARRYAAGDARLRASIEPIELIAEVA